MVIDIIHILRRRLKPSRKYGDDPRDVDYRLETDDYVITVDPWFDVKLTRKDFDHIDIKIEVDDEYDLKELIEFCKGDK